MLPEVKRQRPVLYKRRLRQQRQSYSEKQKQQSVTSSNNMLKQEPRHSKSKIYRYHLGGDSDSSGSRTAKNKSNKA